MLTIKSASTLLINNTRLIPCLFILEQVTEISKSSFKSFAVELNKFNI